MSKDSYTSIKSQQEDELLIKEFLADDHHSFDRLVIKYQSMIFNLCLRIIGDYDDANDCAQETFIKVYHNVKNFRFQSSFATWLYRIAINTCRNRISSSKNLIKKKIVRIDNPANDNDNPLDIHDCSYSPDIIFEKNEQTRLIHQAIDSLPNPLKMLIVLRDIEGKSYEEIADITRIHLGTVKSRLARARHLLRESLREVL